MNDMILAAVIGAIVSLVTSLITTYMQSYKWRSGEGKKIRADAADTLTDTSLAIVNELRNDNKLLREELGELRNRVIEQEAENARLKAGRDKEIVELNKRINELRQTSSDLRDWAERLVHQLKAHDIEPVQIRDQYPRTNE